MGQRKYVRRSILNTPIVLAAALMLGACGGGGDANPGSTTPPPPPPSMWVIMGSSTAEGTGATTYAKSWAGLLLSSMFANNVVVINYAKGGTTTYDGLATTSPQVPNRPSPDVTANITAALAVVPKPKVLLLSYPTNDTANGYSVTETVDNLLAIRDAAMTGGVTVIVLSTQPRDDLSQTMLDRLVEIDIAMSAAVSGCFVAVRAGLAGTDSKRDPLYAFSNDAIHLNDAGHFLIHTKVRELIDSRSCVTLAAP